MSALLAGGGLVVAFPVDVIEEVCGSGGGEASAKSEAARASALAVSCISFSISGVRKPSLVS